MLMRADALIIFFLLGMYFSNLCIIASFKWLYGKVLKSWYSAVEGAISA